ncbi:TetR/AcrR family transcriptional regulator [Marivirga salinae]|uniref:TetR/AcrR family transcriptional regulator n=1 Tax=Marivirga salinarum TaxID=3059078 RepID=A0AA49GB17_9BACT|nr:TetR/AcrR family transcriptional regulator [Marivirga sp. BDSF4-3]WKK77861.2 TetR/AcrR family transcriptional regulator [Marivirga sp. BDSF4-3]
MRDAEATKEKILSTAAGLFNVQGFKATSLKDITDATGLTKGAIYRHFNDKDNLEVCTYDFISAKLQAKLREAIKDGNTAPDKLFAICDFFRAYIHSPIIVGGCPILNAGVESDDTKPGLNLKVKQLLDVFQKSLEHIVIKGMEYNQIKSETRPAQFASIFIASLEGGVLLSKIRKNSKDMEWVIEDLRIRIKNISK